MGADGVCPIGGTRPGIIEMHMSAALNVGRVSKFIWANIQCLG